MKNEKENTVCDTDTCIFCGAQIPEGRMICATCENAIENEESASLIITPVSGNAEVKNNKSEEN